ncbi:MAG: MipA/OmpV family protein [Rhodospirillaceae bacterium]|nr:MipA/OmpV family protein [Rhodospirillaceae bacterium]
MKIATHHVYLPAIATLALAFTHGGDARAQSYFIAGLGATPEYEGATDRQTIPFIAARVSFGKRYLALDGLTAQANLIASRTWEAGPAVAFIFGRNGSVKNSAVALLPEIDDAVHAGFFVARNWSGIAAANDTISAAVQLTKDVSDVYDGWMLIPSMSYSHEMSDRITVSYKVSFGIVSDKYAQTYFSVSQNDAAKSGLSSFTAAGGVKDAGFTFGWTYAIGANWSVNGFSDYRRLLGDAAKSPIVKKGGDADQFSVGLGVGLSF